VATAHAAVDGAHVIDAGVPVPRVFDYRGRPDPYDIPRAMTPVPADAAWDALEEGWGRDSSMRYEGDPQMAAKAFGMVPGAADIHPAWSARAAGPSRAHTIDALRDYALRPFGLTLRGPIRVALQPFGERYVVLHNLNDHAVTMTIGQSVAEELVLPSAAETTIDGDRVTIAPHSLVCLCR
jgi:hypothetical protein